MSGIFLGRTGREAIEQSRAGHMPSIPSGKNLAQWQQPRLSEVGTMLSPLLEFCPLSPLSHRLGT